MARLAVLAALFAAVLFVSNTFAHRTFVTTVEIDEDTNPGRQSQQRCRQEIQRQQQQLQQCDRQLMHRIQQGQDVLAFKGTESYYDNQGHEFQQCCQALKQVDDQCQCDAMQHIMQRQQGRLQGQQRRQLEREIENLPDRCNLGSQAQQCQVSSGREPY
ncbi:Puroindoline b [Quillaja saponaria]|uniref:Puroindoline b n=1 Tax=Quillaja saponaria TaxID=32244 RepID=A0AAD7VN48_QUISA|nr:Puroindoline b [Quillaja saponaria]